jgi:hypothetical protein
MPLTSSGLFLSHFIAAVLHPLNISHPSSPHTASRNVQAFEAYDQSGDKRAVVCLKYMMLCKVIHTAVRRTHTQYHTHTQYAHTHKQWDPRSVLCLLLLHLPLQMSVPLSAPIFLDTDRVLIALFRVLGLRFYRACQRMSLILC